MLLGTISASLLQNLLTSKGIKAKILRRDVIRIGEGTIRAGKEKIRAGEGTIRAMQDFSSRLIL